MTVVVDTGPLLAAANRRDKAHALAAALVDRLGPDLLVPLPVAVETDHLLRRAVSHRSAQLFLDDLKAGFHAVGYLTQRLLERAVELDATYASLNLGLVDTSVMAIAEKLDAPVLTFDFRAFRATTSAVGHWRLLVDEDRYRELVG
jgi:hypothetical protein